MVENFQAEIGARIRDFQNAMREVDRQIRDTALGADADIGADLSEFMSEMGAVNAILADLARENDIPIDGDIDDFMEDAAIVQATIWSFMRDRIVIPIEARVNKFQATIGRIASTTRAFGELMQTTFRGIAMSLSPALVPLISSLVGVIGQLGPMVGVLAGSTFALGSAFAVAGIGAAGFGAIAVSNLKDIFGASSDLKKLNEKLNDTTDMKKRIEIMKKMDLIQDSLSDGQARALASIDKLKMAWAQISDSLETQTIDIFVKALDIFGGVLTALHPMFVASTNAVNNLMDSLGKSVQSESMMKFFDYLNNSAGPMLETMAKSFGNFFKGIINMMVAFTPLTDSTSQGFLKMSESFEKWSAGLGESKKFQAFVDYVNENMPKIRSIFSDAFQGIINIFAGFAPSSADMMTSLEAMMQRFKEWSSTISANQGFQNFINYIKENGPQVIAAIGNIVTAIVNIGIALAPMGSKILEMVNTFIAWTNSMMENHPVIGKVGAAVLVLMGALIAIAPNIIAFGSLFGGVATLIMAKTALMRAQFVLGMKMMVTSMLAAGKQMVVTAGQFVAKWAVIGAQSLVHAAKVAAAWLLATGKAMATAIASMATAAAQFIAKWVLMGAQALLHAAKVAAGWALSTGAAMVKSLASMIATSAVFVAKWVWMGVQALAQAARMAAAWFIALGPVGWVIGAVVGLAVLIIANWDKIKSATINIWTAVSEAVKKAWEAVKTKTIEAVKILGDNIAKMPGKVKEFAKEMLSAGKDLIMGLINGIKGMAGDAINAITGVVDGVIGKAKSLLGIHSPSWVFDQIGQFLGIGMANGVSSTKKLNEKAISELGKVMTEAAKENAKAISVIATEGEKERTALQKESAAKAKEIERKAEEDIYQIQAMAKAKKRKLTTSESLRIEQIRKDANRKLQKLETDNQAELKKINDKTWSDMVKRDKEGAKERFDAIQTFVDYKLKLEGLSAIQEALIWKKAADSFKQGTQEKLDAQVNYRDKLRQIQADIESTNEKYSKRMLDIDETLAKETIKIKEDLANRTKDINEKVASEIAKINEDLVSNSRATTDKLSDDINRLNDNYSKTFSDLENKLRNSYGLFEKLDTTPKETGTELLDNLQSQVDGFKSWESEIAKLSAKGINDGLLEELRDMGPKALPQLQALNSMTSEQLTKYSSLYSEKSALARAEAEEQLIGMKADTQRQITELRMVANAELDRMNMESQQRIVALRTNAVNEISLMKKEASNEIAELRKVASAELKVLQTDWNKDIVKLTTDTNKELKTLEQIGKDAISGLITGMSSMKGALQAEAQAIANSVQATLKSALQIHSPSRVLEKLGEFTGQGFANGLSNSISKVVAISKELASAALPVLSGVKMAPLETQSQMDSLHRQIKQELSVDMNVNHTGGYGGTGGGFTQEVHLHSPRELSPSENARTLRRIGQEQALGWGI